MGLRQRHSHSNSANTTRAERRIIQRGQAWNRPPIPLARTPKAATTARPRILLLHRGSSFRYCLVITLKHNAPTGSASGLFERLGRVVEGGEEQLCNRGSEKWVRRVSAGVESPVKPRTTGRPPGALKPSKQADSIDLFAYQRVTHGLNCSSRCSRPAIRSASLRSLNLPTRTRYIVGPEAGVVTYA